MKVAKNACPKEIRMTLQWKGARFELALHFLKKKKGKNMNQTILAEHFQRCPKCDDLTICGQMEMGTAD